MNNNNPNDKRSMFWTLFFGLIVPVIGLIITVVAFLLDENIILILIALPMLLSFFITAGVIIYKAFKSEKEQGINIATDEDDEYYETDLNISDKAILMYEENPYKNKAIKSMIIILLSIFGPMLLSYLLRDSKIMILGLYLKNICSALPIILGFWTLCKGWSDIANFFEFKRAKKILISKQQGNKKPFLFPRMNILSLLFLLLTVVVLVSTFQDINTLNDYKKNGVAVNAVSYKVEEEGDDHYVYFKYTYDGKEYSYMKMNYPGGTKIDNEVEAYLYPDKPEELYLYYSSSYAVYIMLTGALFFLWMGNGYKKSLLAACFLIEGCVAMGLGVAAGTAGNMIWGVLFLICALLTWRRCKKKANNN